MRQQRRDRRLPRSRRLLLPPGPLRDWRGRSLQSLPRRGLGKSPCQSRRCRLSLARVELGKPNRCSLGRLLCEGDHQSSARDWCPVARDLEFIQASGCSHAHEFSHHNDGTPVVRDPRCLELDVSELCKQPLTRRSGSVEEEAMHCGRLCRVLSCRHRWNSSVARKRVMRRGRHGRTRDTRGIPTNDGIKQNHATRMRYATLNRGAIDHHPQSLFRRTDSINPFQRRSSSAFSCSSKRPRAANAKELLWALQAAGIQLGRRVGLASRASAISIANDASFGVCCSIPALSTQADAVEFPIGSSSSIGAVIFGSYDTNKTG